MKNMSIIIGDVAIRYHGIKIYHLAELYLFATDLFDDETAFDVRKMEGYDAQSSYD